MRRIFCVLALPLLAQQDVSVYSAEKERTLGQHLASEIRRLSTPLTDPAVDAYVKRVGTELTRSLQQPPYEYEFEAISGSEQTEPMSLPGGNIFIPARSFVASQDESEFIGILAHSIGHAALRHGTRTATRPQAGNTAAIPLVFFGGWNGLHADSQRLARITPAALTESQRTWEFEADRFGLDLTARAGYDPAGYLRYVRRLHRPDTKNWPLPVHELRLAKLQETLSSLKVPLTTGSGDEFLLVQQAVRSVIERPEPRRVPTLKR